LIKTSFYLTNQVDFGIMIADLYTDIIRAKGRFASSSWICRL